MSNVDVEVTLNQSHVSTELQLNAKELELTINGYRGVQGIQGEVGPQGPPGQDGDGSLAIAYAVALG